jgi:hypothetical protein
MKPLAAHAALHRQSRANHGAKTAGLIVEVSGVVFFFFFRHFL